MEKCERCGKQYSTVYTVRDCLWESITGHKDGSGLWCLHCFVNEAEKLGIVLYWQCDENQFPALEPPIIPKSCNVCPVISCHSQTKYSGNTCLMRLRRSLRRNPAYLKVKKRK